MNPVNSANGRRVDQASAAVSAARLVERLGRWSQGDGTLAERLARAIALLIDTGELRAADRLPAERALASAASVSRGTVVAAYAMLTETGALERRQGSGTRVSGAVTRPPAPERVGRTEALFSALPSSIDLLRAVPQVPESAMRIVHDHRPDFDVSLLSEADPVGLPLLRERIAQQFADEGTPTTPEQIIVTHGAQSALHLLIEELVSPGDVVLAEELTWPGLSDLVRRRGGAVVAVPIGENGIDLAALEAAMARMRPALVAVNPHHHNPTGTRMPDAARLRLAGLAAEYGVPVLEDRVLAPISFDGVVPPTLAALRPDAPILVAESLSKWAWAGLRVGWLRADPVTVRRMRGIRQTFDMFTSVPAQLLALDFFDSIEPLRREVSAQHGRRMLLLRELLAEHLPDWRYTPPRGGLSLWAELPEGTAEGFIALAARRGVAIAGTGAFSVSVSGGDGIRLPFTASDDVLREGVRRLGEAWREPGEHREQRR